MFQYAAAKSLALKHATIVKLDVSDYAHDPLRKFELGHFTIDASIARTKDVAQISFSEGVHFWVRHNNNFLSNNIRRLLKIINLKSSYVTRYYQYNPAEPPPQLLIGRTVSQRFFHFDEEFSNCPDNVLLIGTWISYKYSYNIRDILIKEFNLRRLSSRVERIYCIISNKNSIAVHVRRSDKLTESVYPVVPLSFYKNAMEYFRSQYSDCNFYIFSDDEKWAKTNIRGSDCFHVENEPDAPPAEDLWLMSRCQHNIVPASSFSWWAAWLNENSRKQIVITHPSYWIALPNFDTFDISPSDWIVMS